MPEVTSGEKLDWEDLHFEFLVGYLPERDLPTVQMRVVGEKAGEEKRRETMTLAWYDAMDLSATLMRSAVGALYHAAVMEYVQMCADEGDHAGAQTLIAFRRWLEERDRANAAEEQVGDGHV